MVFVLLNFHNYLYCFISTGFKKDTLRFAKNKQNLQLDFEKNDTSSVDICIHALHSTTNHLGHIRRYAFEIYPGIRTFSILLLFIYYRLGALEIEAFIRFNEEV